MIGTPLDKLRRSVCSPSLTTDGYALVCLSQFRFFSSGFLCKLAIEFA